MAQPQIADSGVQELLTVGPFLGIDASTSKYFLDQYHANDSIAVVPNRAFQGYLTARGRVHAFTGSYASALFGLTKFQRAGVADIYVGACNSAGNGILQQSALGGAPVNVALPITLAPSFETSFVPYQQWLFETNGNDTPLKIDTNLIATRWQMAAPAAAPTVAAGAAGALLGTYYYLVTFVNGFQESSPSPVSTAVSLTNQKGSLTAIPVSTDSQCTGRNIYRFGGTMTEVLLVGTISDNTTTTFTDNTADALVSGQTLIQHRDAPQPFYAIETHKGRVWGFGYTGTAVGEPASIQGTSDLWYSNFEEPWGFNSVAQVIPIGRNSGGDSAVEVKRLGSILCCLKSKSFWTVIGDTPQDFVARQLAPIGCASKKSVAAAYGRLFWLSDEGAVYMFDGAQFTNISDNRATGANSSIKGILDGFTTTDFAAATGAAYDQTYLISFPTQGITFMYDILTGQWFKLPWAFDRAVFDLEAQNQVIAAETSTGVLDSWFAAETDLGAAITSSYISRITDSGAPQSTKRYRYAVVLAPVQTGASATVTVTGDPGGTQKVNTRAVNLGLSPPSHKVSLPPNMLGSEVQITIAVTSTARTEIHRVSLYGWIERQFVSQG